MRRQNSTVRILILVFAVLIAIVAIFDVVYYFVKKNQLQSIALTPEFTETSLEVGTQYTFKIVTTPAKASIKKAVAVVDDPTSSFEIRNDQAILTTGMNEGNVTVYIECKDQKSQVLTFAVVDSVARAQAEAAAAAGEEKKAEEEAAAAAAEAEAAVAKMYVKCTGDDVNVRSTNSTDGDVLGKAKKGYMFEKVEDVDDWTHIKYKDGDGYMKSEFLVEISEEEYNEGPLEEETTAEEEKKSEIQSKEEAKKKADEAKAAQDLEKAAEDLKKAAEDQNKAQDDLAAAQQPTAEATTTEAPAVDANALAALQTIDVNGCKVTAAEYRKLLDYFDYATANHTDEEKKAVLYEHNAGNVLAVLQSMGLR